jgi:hypothetical protein
MENAARGRRFPCGLQIQAAVRCGHIAARPSASVAVIVVRIMLRG